MNTATQQTLATESLTTIQDGALAAELDAAIGQCLADIHARPKVDRPRKVTLEITLAPELGDNTGDLVGVLTGFVVKTATPKAEIAHTLMQLHQEKNIFGESVVQATFFDNDGNGTNDASGERSSDSAQQ